MGTDLYAEPTMTPDLQERFQRLWMAEGRVMGALGYVEKNRDDAGRLEKLREACAAFGVEIAAACPPSADRAAAERCARLAWVLGCEGVSLQDSDPAGAQYPFGLALAEALRARLQACAAVALAAPGTLPPLVD